MRKPQTKLWMPVSLLNEALAATVRIVPNSLLQSSFAYLWVGPDMHTTTLVFCVLFCVVLHLNTGWEFLHCSFWLLAIWKLLFSSNIFSVKISKNNQMVKEIMCMILSNSKLNNYLCLSLPLGFPSILWTH